MDQHKADQLVLGVVARDAKAEKEVYAAFSEEVEFLVRLKIGRDNPDWRDVHQEIFVAFFQRLREGQYNRSLGTLGAFLQSTIKFKIMDYRKSPRFTRRHSYDDVTELPMAAPEPDPESKLQSKQTAEAIKKALMTLQEPYKKILYLTLFKEYKIKQISKMMQMPEQRVSNLKSYALSLLKAQLEGNISGFR